MKHSKKYLSFREKIDRRKRYPLADAVKILKENKFAKFDETVEVSVRLGVDPKHADQMVRGTVALPNGTGKTVRVAVFAQGDKAAEATAAGADFVGAEDLAEKIKGGWTDFDVAVATPDMMRILGQLGKILGPRGLMPNPKTGTVTMDITRAVKELRGGRIEFRIDRQSNIAVRVGKISFGEAQLVENVHAFMDAIMRAKPASAKGTYVLSASICTTMSPGVKLDFSELSAALKK
ncbi:50S ribosomal protein L1 [candidate division GN15 bacterium]|uniref:Large ribosomal subunit protein uL1 n=1 Tax=candidate division GN15 bacterium TaxID=2072418 RepID=A0A855X1X9_9BACT|nr:MAG: 50S ribosomal protein L1 [candidate division GN15 bacterium]